MSAAQPDPTNSSSSAGNQRCATSRPAAGLEASSAMVIVTADPIRGQATAGRARGRSERRAARAPPRVRPARCGSPSTWQQQRGPGRSTYTSATGMRRHAGLRRASRPGEERRHAAQDAPRGTRAHHHQVQQRRRRCAPPGATMAPLPYWRPLAKATRSGRTHYVAAAVHVDGQVVGLELAHLAQAPPARSPPVPLRCDQSPQSAAPRAHPGPCRPR